MKSRIVLTAAARADRRHAVWTCRQEVGAAAAMRLVVALRKSMHSIGRDPFVGSKSIGTILKVSDLRYLRIESSNLSIWYFDVGDFVMVVRIVDFSGERLLPDTAKLSV